MRRLENHPPSVQTSLGPRMPSSGCPHPAHAAREQRGKSNQTKEVTLQGEAAPSARLYARDMRARARGWSFRAAGDGTRRLDAAPARQAPTLKRTARPRRAPGPDSRAPRAAPRPAPPRGGRSRPGRPPRAGWTADPAARARGAPRNGPQAARRHVRAARRLRPRLRPARARRCPARAPAATPSSCRGCCRAQQRAAAPRARRQSMHTANLLSLFQTRRPAGALCPGNECGQLAPQTPHPNRSARSGAALGRCGRAAARACFCALRQRGKGEGFPFGAGWCVLWP